MGLQLADLLRPGQVQEVHTHHGVGAARGQERPAGGEGGAQHLSPGTGTLDELDGLGAGKKQSYKQLIVILIK